MIDRLRPLARGVVGRFRKHELLLRASAIAFQVLTAIVPFALFLTGAAGFFGLTEAYSNELAPKIQDGVSLPAFSLINETMTKVLGGQNTFWVTVGLALAIWQLSGAVRTAGKTLDVIHEVEEERPWKDRMLRSLGVAAVVAACLLGAVAIASVAPIIYGDVGWLLGTLLWVVRYALVVGLLVLAIGVVVRHGTAERHPAGWLSPGAILAAVLWIAVTAAFGAYITAIASFGSIYGVFFSVVVLLAWTYASSMAFLIGVATDAELRERTG